MQTKSALTKDHLKQALRELLSEPEQSHPSKYPDHQLAIAPWVKAMQVGTLTGKSFSSHTVENYLRYVDYFIKRYGEISFRYLEAEFLNTPVEMFGRKDKFYRAILCFAKFLVREHSLEASFLEEARQIKPKRHYPPRRLSLNEQELERLYGVCTRLDQELTIRLLATTGVRASEFCALKISDLDLEHRCLTVQRGKGGKRRKVGLNNTVIDLLQRYLESRRPYKHEDFLFLNRFGQKMERDGLLNRLRRLGRLADVKVSPHALRRAFVTINANKGRSLVMLQIACGHSDIKTTRSYCQTTEDEVIQAMKDWQ